VVKVARLYCFTRATDKVRRAHDALVASDAEATLPSAKLVENDVSGQDVEVLREVLAQFVVVIRASIPRDYPRVEVDGK